MISIIIPVYNAEKTIVRCLDSLLLQKYQDWQAILIDDGSSDNSGRICDEYQQSDSRFKVVHKQNGGVGSARNVGLENVRGEYVAFCDSDDYANPDWLKSLVSHIESYDVVVGGANYIQGDSTENFVLNTQETRPAQAADLMSATESFGYLWNKLFKFSVIREQNIRFNEHFRFLEDEEFICHYWCFVKNVKFAKSIGYNYIVPNFEKKYSSIDNYQLYLDLLDHASHFILYDDSCTMRKYTMGVFRSMMLAYERHNYCEGWNRLRTIASLSVKYRQYNCYMRMINKLNYVLWHPFLIMYNKIKKIKL